MDGMLCSMQKRKPTKRSKPKSKPIKVVYISNPMRVKTSASQFRALVQKLTGRDAEFPDPAKFHGSDPDGVGAAAPRAVVDAADDDVVEPGRRLSLPKVGSVQDLHHHHQNHPSGDHGRLGAGNYEPFDDVFTPQMLETLLLPSSLLYESSPMDSA
ncbi:uncharacterized protein LOC104444112 [Eucalyptus grandis]|uniref:Uncharacterized protein n=2 Tax=Eucalyptus grandis TaxID=71139 RepID=A0ACC3M5W1_EUCGR|nr:uncharacterized protein LOC104444112 [Eucalyptus grandis]KAK3446558.1 hypothetical protein EUGRSUZ_A02242 [Eucalyptus grandis]